MIHHKVELLRSCSIILTDESSAKFSRIALSINGETSIATASSMFGLSSFNILIKRPFPVPRSRTLFALRGMWSSKTDSPSALCGILFALVKYSNTFFG
jgi:hypothetical protein